MSGYAYVRVGSNRVGLTVCRRLPLLLLRQRTSSGQGRSACLKGGVGDLRWRPSHVRSPSDSEHRNTAATRDPISLSGVAARRTGSPGRKGTSERRAPKRLAAWASVAEFGPRTASPPLDAALRLAAQQHHEFRSLAGLRAQRLVRDDQGGSRRNAGDAIQCVLRNGDAVERGLCAVRVRRHRLNIATTIPARPVVWLNRATGRTSAAQ